MPKPQMKLLTFGGTAEHVKLIHQDIPKMSGQNNLFK